MFISMLVFYIYNELNIKDLKTIKNHRQNCKISVLMKNEIENVSLE